MLENLPCYFVPSFTNERLTIIAKALLEQCYRTDDDLQSDYDSGYSIGCTRFDRQKNCLKNMALEHSWLNISDGSNRLVMNIDGAPFRFTRDNYLAPKKQSSTTISSTEAIQITKFSQSQQLGFDWGDENIDNDTPNKWRFFVDVTEGLEGHDNDYEIFFVGLSALDQPCCVWRLAEHSSISLHSVEGGKPETVKSEPAKTTLPNTEKRRKLSDE
ncbi:hypothetical protein [Aliivibrio fischeri]|uniref:hypothetical protein n=1 Tax=Aliivibrio fischeri TaxID=668 RepID=UPI00080DE804|nr:hypothetical protein [Aliivibrio fischeri]OCH38837.1 hypothetical protein A6E02_17685 [Aliivibrio fischeri]